ncbi:MAG: uroporphyrinogen-III C-methyltransferase [Erysipelotrichaceae bacterium]|nr:uroporphyrinogen-III C-methyltransferase [Erysipelotrichaceae bacterium]
MGKVYLIGAGPGALDLYTVKALECIRKADCMIYDQLIDNRILKEVKAGCELIYAGKKAHNHAIPQEEMNALLVEKSKEYDTVVRLKGGDVYVFGRGGEEGQALYDAGVDFEVVPGLSSVMAGLAYAGIPITHRGLANSFCVYTGVLAKDTMRDFCFEEMLDDTRTYVFLMSMARRNDIVNGLLAAGKDPSTPVAIVSKASMEDQKVLVSTLDGVLEEFEKDPLENPGIIVVGNVVTMQPVLNFYDKMRNRPKVLATMVGEDHYFTDHLPQCSVEEVITGNVRYLDADIPDLPKTFVFTSKHGVVGFMKNYISKMQDIRKLSGSKFVCIGEKTRDTLASYGLVTDCMPSKADSACINKEVASDLPMVLVRGSLPSNVDICEEELVVYENASVSIENTSKHYRYGLFTSASSVERYHAASDAVIDTFVSIGAHTTKAIRKAYGEVRILESSVADKSAMVKLVEEDL